MFAEDTADFALTVLHEEGEYRHLRFGKPGERWGSTDIHTWPHGLTTAGDMADGWMFERGLGFFGGNVNLPYWHEKLTPAGRRAAKEFDAHALREALAQEAVDLDVPEEHRAALADALSQLADEITVENADTMAALAAVEGFTFECEDEDGLDLDVRISDPYELDVEDYTYHFVWACHVLATASAWLRHGDSRVIYPQPVPAAAPATTHHLCDKCGYDQPATGAVYRGCPRCPRGLDAPAAHM